jgi:hypothetical protein
MASYEEIWSPARKKEMSACYIAAICPEVRRAVRFEQPRAATRRAGACLTATAKRSEKPAMESIPPNALPLVMKERQPPHDPITDDVAQVRCVTLPQDLKHVLPVLVRSLELRDGWRLSGGGP